MKAMVLERTCPVNERPLRLVTLPDPEPGPGEILVRVQACAVCRTDLHVIEGDLPQHTLPIVPGHQIVGEVLRTGPGATAFSGGEVVGIAWLRGTCGQCRYCRAGQENLCPRSRYTGYHEHGGYAELAVVPEAFAYRIPARFAAPQAAPLLCAGIIGYRALERAEIPAAGRLALYGFGSSASVVIQLALHRGHEVYVVTRGESHRTLATEMGAHWVGGTGEAPPVEMDGAIIFAPSGDIVPDALRSIRKGGTVAMAGIYMSPIPELDYETHLFHEKNLRSVEANTREDGRELLSEAATVAVRTRVTEFRLEQANDALIALKADRIDGSAVLVMR